MDYANAALIISGVVLLCYGIFNAGRRYERGLRPNKRRGIDAKQIEKHP